MPFLMIRNDITKVAADAIVNPANRNLLQGSGTSRAIYQAAGEQELTAACEAIGRCDLGRAVCTPAFGLPAKYIFHAVCPAWHGGGFGEAEQLAGAYHSALELAAEYHCESVAFPLLSSGNYGYPKEQAFRIAVDTITQYVMEHDLTVYLVLYDRDSLAVSRKLFASVEEYIDDHYVAQNDESYGFGRRRRELSERRRLLEEDVAVPMLGAVPAPAAAPRTARSLESLMDNLGESFTTRLLRLIDERGLKDSTVYRQSNISRQHFSKIQCNRDYNPKKKTVLAFAVGLHLSEDETIDLLKSAGYAFSDGSKRDWIVVTLASPSCSFCRVSMALNPPMVSCSSPPMEPLRSRMKTSSVRFFFTTMPSVLWCIAFVGKRIPQTGGQKVNGQATNYAPSCS